MSTILVPLDWSELSAQALPYAGYLARLLGAEVRLLHIVAVGEQEALAAREYLGPGDEAAGAQQVEWYAATYLEEQAAPLRALGLVVHGEVVAGSPPEAIVAAADRCDAALVVMATHGRGGIGRRVVGSVAHEVLRTATRPLLAVRREAPGSPELRRILVPLDASRRAREALPLALTLAERSGATLVLLAVFPPHHERGPAAERRPEPRERLFAELDALVASCRDVQIVAADESSAGRAICRAAEAQQADLIVMTTQGYSEPRPFAPGSVTDKVLHGTSVPALIVPSAAG